MLDEHEFDGDDEDEDEPDVGDLVTGRGWRGNRMAGVSGGNSTAVAARQPRHPYMIGNNISLLDKLWEQHEAAGDHSLRTNILFKFVDGEYDNVPYDELAQTVFRTGVLAEMQTRGGLALIFILPPLQSAVMQFVERS